MQQKRILWLDQLKAIAFFFVILGHMSITGEPKNWIYSFHMPLFFLVSGFTFNLEKTAKSQFLPYCGKLFKRLVIPYFWIEMICLCFSYLTTVLIKGKPLHLTQNLIGIVVSNGLLYPYPSRPMYFALVLFSAQILLWVVLRLVKGNRIGSFVLTLALCSFSFLTIGKPMVWRINVVPVAMLLILIGTLLRLLFDRLREPIETGNFVWLYIIGAVLFAAGFVLQHFNGRLSMAGNRYGDIMPVGLLSAVLTTCALALFLMRLPVPKVMALIGQNTFFYMGFHRPLITLLETLFPADKTSWWYLLCGSLLIFFGLAPVVLLVNKTCAFLCCKETAVETKATLAGKWIATCLAFVIPYEYALLQLQSKVGGTTLHAILLVLFFPLCAGVVAILRKLLPDVYLIKRSIERDRT